MPFDGWLPAKHFTRNGKTVWRRMPWLFIKNSFEMQAHGACIITDFQTLNKVQECDLIDVVIFLIIEKEKFEKLSTDQRPKNIARVCYNVSQAIHCTHYTNRPTHILGDKSLIANALLDI